MRAARSDVCGRLVVAVLVVSSACVVVTDDTLTSNDEVGDGDGDPTAGDGDGDPGDGDGDPTTGDGDGDPTTGDGDGDGCSPRDAALSITYAPFDFGVGDPWEVDLDWTCTVTSSGRSNLELTLDCPEAPGPVTLEIDASPGFSVPVSGGETLQVRYIYEGPWWFNIYLRLDLEGHGHLLTLIDGDSLLPPAAYDFELPLAVTPISGLCAPAPDGCGQLERLGLELEGDAVVLDGQHASVDGVDVWIARAGHLHAIACTDTPDEWFRVLIVSP